MDSKSKKKAKNTPKSQEEPSGSKKNFQKKKNKGEMRKCAYYSKGYHLERSCMKKQIDMLTQLLEKNNISLLGCTKKREGGSNSDDKERAHALVAITSRSSTFIIDSGASRHLVSTRETFSSLDDSKGPKIVLGDDFAIDSIGKGKIDLDHGSFNNVFYVLGITTNLF